MDEIMNNEIHCRKAVKRDIGILRRSPPPGLSRWSDTQAKSIHPYYAFPCCVRRLGGGRNTETGTSPVVAKVSGNSVGNCWCRWPTQPVTNIRNARGLNDHQTRTIT